MKFSMTSTQINFLYGNFHCHFYTPEKTEKSQEEVKNDVKLIWNYVHFSPNTFILSREFSVEKT